MREPMTAADVIEDLCHQYGVDPTQRISTLIKACEDVELFDDEDLDDDYDDF